VFKGASSLFKGGLGLNIGRTDEFKGV